MLTNPDRVVVDIAGVHLNSVLKGIAQVHADDPYLKQARVGQFDQHTVRLVLELKHSVSPHIFSLAPVPEYHHRLVLDPYPTKGGSGTEYDPLLTLLEDYNQGVLDRTLPAEAAQARNAGHDRPIIIMLDPGHSDADPGAIGMLQTR